MKNKDVNNHIMVYKKPTNKFQFANNYNFNFFQKKNKQSNPKFMNKFSKSKKTIDAESRMQSSKALSV